MFRPCIDLHQGRVKQIVGGTLRVGDVRPRENFVSDRDASWFASLYQRDGLKGGHVIMLGPGNEDAAWRALSAYPGGMQAGGGIDLENAAQWIGAGASHVIVTSWLFQNGELDWTRLEALSGKVGKEKLVVDLSCRKRDGEYVVVIDRWQTFTKQSLGRDLFEKLSEYCDEFLIHAVDVEGLCLGIDHELVSKLADECPVPVTYAGGANSLEDLETVTRVGKGRIDLTIGSALDIFGGTGVCYEDVVAFNRRQTTARQSSFPTT